MSTEHRGVVVIGDALIDEIRDASGVRELVGGAALNVAVGLRRLGVPATLIAMVGADAAGDHIREYLADHDVALVERPSAYGSSRAIVQRAANGEPEYVFNEAAQRRSIRYSDAARDAIPIVVAQSRHQQIGLRFMYRGVMQAARNRQRHGMADHRGIQDDARRRQVADVDARRFAARCA